jgi:hypothetical protein
VVAIVLTNSILYHEQPGAKKKIRTHPRLSGGWEETRHATLELLQFTPRQFSSFLGLLTANISKGFGGPERYIKANEYATLIEEVSVETAVDCFVDHDSIGCPTLKVVIIGCFLGPHEAIMVCNHFGVRSSALCSFFP